MAGFGMYRGDDVLEPLRKYYGSVLKAFVVQPILATDSTRMREVKTQLQSVSEAQHGARVTVDAAQRGQLLEMVQLQLLLADARGKGVPSVASRKPWLLDQLAVRWDRADREGDVKFHKSVTTRYLDMLTKDEQLAIDVDDDTIDFARRALGGDSPTDRALNALIARFESQDMDLKALAGLSHALKAPGNIPARSRATRGRTCTG